jgi:hypothetical protein
VLIRRGGALIAAERPKNKESGERGFLREIAGRRRLLRSAGSRWRAGRSFLGGRGLGGGKPRFQCCDPGLERFILLAGKARHVLDGLEFLAVDHRKVAQNTLRLVAEQRLGLAPYALRDAGRIVHQSGDVVEEPVRRLDHVRLRKDFGSENSERIGALLAIATHNGNGGAPSQGVRRRIRLRKPRRDALTSLELLMLVLPVIPFPAINPVLISVGPFSIRWYALAYIVGIIAGWF